eukprot:12933-Heterococcus_DN1.PRE.1
MATSDSIAIALVIIVLSDMEFASCRVSPTGVIHSAVSCYLTRRDHLEQVLSTHALAVASQ